MPRYIDLDKALARLENSLKWCEEQLGDTSKEYKIGCISAIKDDISNISHMETEDVVPRAEVEDLQKTCDLFSETIKEMDNEIERLKVSDASKEECTIRQHCEIKELKAELRKAKQEVVNEIIQLIEEQIAEPKHHGYKDVRNDELAQLTIKILKKYKGE